MAVYMGDFSLKTQGENHFSDITGRVSELVERSGVRNGIANVFLLSTTSSLLLCENEAGLLEDIIRSARSFAPDNAEYRHNQAWGDDNGRSHVKAAVYRQELNIPIRKRKLHLGTWQSLFLLEFDVRPRERRISITITGE